MKSFKRHEFGIFSKPSAEVATVMSTGRFFQCFCLFVCLFVCLFFKGLDQMHSYRKVK